MSLGLNSTNDVLTALNKIYGVAQKQGNPVTASVLGYGMLGSDYAASPAFQWAKVDSSGFLYVQATSVGNPNVNIAQVGGVATSMGQKLMASSWPVVLASDQSAIPVSQSGVWSVGRTWTLGSGTDSVAAVQSGTWTVQQGTPPWSVSQSGSWSVTATGSTTPADTFTNPTNALLGFSLLAGFNATTWDRLRTVGTGILKTAPGSSTDLFSVITSPLADAISNTPGSTTQVQATQSFPLGFNGTTWDRLRTVGTGILKVGVYDSSSTPISIFSGGFGDSIVNSSYNELIVDSMVTVFNGTSWDRTRSIPGATGTTGTGLLGVGMLAFDATGGTNYQRIQCEAEGDARTRSSYFQLVVGSSESVFNGSTWDRLRSATALSNSTAGLGVTLANYNNSAMGILPTLIMAYDGTTNANAYRALQVTSGGILLAAQSGTWNIGTVTTLSQFPSTALLGDATANPTLTQIQVFPSAFNGTTWDRLHVYLTPGDAAATNKDLLPTMSVSYGYNGTTWDQLRTASGANVTTGTGLLGTAVMGFDGTNYQRVGITTANSDAIATSLISLDVLNFNYAYNGTTWDRLRSFSTGVLEIGIVNAGSITGGANVTVAPLSNDANGGFASLTTISFVQVFNGTTWDRLRTATAFSGTTLNGTLANFTNSSTGILAALAVGYDPTASANAYRALQVTSGGILLAAQSGTWTVQQGSAPWSVSQSGTWNIGTVTTVTTLSQLPSTAALADATSNPTLTQIQVFPMGWNGTTWDRLQVDASKNLKVLAAQTGTWNIGTVTTVTTLSQFPSAAALSDAFSNPTTTQIGAMLMGWNTSTWDRLQVDSSKRLKIVDPIDVTGVVNNPADVSVSTAAALSMSANLFDSVTLLADDQNGDSILVGNSTRQAYPLRAGASVTLKRVIPNNIYVKAKSGTQTLHVIGGGT